MNKRELLLFNYLGEARLRGLLRESENAYSATLFVTDGDLDSALLVLEQSKRILDVEKYLYADILFKLCRHRDAFLQMKQFIREKPEQSFAYFIAGITKMAIGDDEKAIDYYNRAITREEGYSDFYYYRGLSRSELYQDEEAIADYNRALERDNQKADYYHARALSKKRLCDFQGALGDLEAARRAGLLDCLYDDALNSIKRTMKKAQKPGKRAAILAKQWRLRNADELINELSQDFTGKRVQHLLLGYERQGKLWLQEGLENGNYQSVENINKIVMGILTSTANTIFKHRDHLGVFKDSNFYRTYLSPSIIFSIQTTFNIVFHHLFEDVHLENYLFDSLRNKFSLYTKELDKCRRDYVNLKKMHFDGKLEPNKLGEKYNFAGANLREAIFKNQKLDDFDFTCANLSGADFSNCSFDLVDLTKTKMQGISCVNAQNTFNAYGEGSEPKTVNKCNMRFANLSNMSFNYHLVYSQGRTVTLCLTSKIKGSDLSHANLASSLLKVTIKRSKLIDVYARNIETGNLEVHHVIAPNINLFGSGLGGGIIRNSQLNNSDLRYSNLRNTIFNRSSLNRATLESANTDKCQFQFSDLQNTNLSETLTSLSSLFKTNLNNAQFSNSVVNTKRMIASNHLEMIPNACMNGRDMLSSRNKRLDITLISDGIISGFVGILTFVSALFSFPLYNSLKKDASNESNSTSTSTVNNILEFAFTISITILFGALTYLALKFRRGTLNRSSIFRRMSKNEFIRSINNNAIIREEGKFLFIDNPGNANDANEENQLFFRR